MEAFCGTSGNVGGIWIYNECHADWLNVGVSLCSMYVSLMLLGYLRWTQDRGKTLLHPNKFQNHSLRGLLAIFLLFIHSLEISDALISLSSTNVVTVPTASLGHWAAAVVLSHVLENVRRPQFLFLTSSLWTFSGLARVLRLLSVLQNGARWDTLRTLTSLVAAAVMFSLAVCEAVAGYCERRKKGNREHLETTSSRYKHDESNLFSQATFHWLTELLRIGHSCPLECEDLGALPDKHRSRTHLDTFNAIFYGGKAVNKPVSNFWRTCWAFMQCKFLLGGLLKLAGDLLTLVAPLGISAFVNYIGKQSEKGVLRQWHYYTTLEHLWENGWAVAFLVLVASIAQSTCSQASTHLVNVRGLHLYAALQAKIYTKSLSLNKHKVRSDVEDKSKPDEETNEGTVTHLLTEDAENIMAAFWVGHYIWAIPLKIALLITMLYKCLGIAAIIGSVITIVVVTPLQLIIGRQMSVNASALSDVTDERIQLVGSLIGNIKILKMLGWEKTMIKKIQDVRRREENKLGKDSILWAAITMLTHFAAILVSVVTLAIFSWLGEEALTATTVFTALALFNHLTVPLFIFPVTVPIFIAAKVSGERLAEYFQQKEIEQIMPTVEDKGDDASSVVGHTFLTSQLSYSESVGESENIWLPMDSIDPMYAEAKPTEGDFEPLEAPSERQELLEPGDVDVVNESEPALTIQDGVFTWSADSKQMLNLGSFTIPKGKLTMVVGSIGSGKSALLSAILGEMQPVTGQVSWRRGTTVAFAGQTPWLLNGTVRDNIIFGRPFKARRYSQVIEACALLPDLSILPSKDLTEVGERGILLSGGQKQRIAIARALYSKANFVILDDPLSSLDRGVATQVFEAGIQRLVRRGTRTVLLVTHMLQLLPHSHKVIVMQQCKIRIQGQLNDIETLDTSLVASWRDSLGSTAGNCDGSSLEKTARERWQLVRLVASIGHEIQNKFSDPDEDFAQTILTRKSTRRRRPAFSEWTYLSDDLPSPIEECGVVRPTWRQQSTTSRSRFMSRANSLQARHVRNTPVTRQMSSPLVFNRGSHRKPSSRQLLKHLLRDRPKVGSGAGVPRRHMPVQRLSSTESGFSDAKSEVDPEDFDDLEVGANSPTEDREYGQVPRRVLLLYATACGIPVVIGFGFISLAGQAARVLTDTWLSKWTEDGEASENVSFYLYIYMALSAVTLLLSLASYTFGQGGGWKARVYLHEKLLQHVAAVNVSSLETIPTGRFLNRFSTDMTVIDKKLATSVQRLVQFLLLCASALLVNAAVTPWFLAVALPICLLYHAIQRFYRASSRELQRLESISRSPVVSHLAETLTGLPTIRAFGYQRKFTAGFLGKLDSHINAFLILNSANRWLGIVLDYLGAVIVFVAMATALITAHVAPGKVTAALAGLALNYTLLVPIYLNWVVKFVTECEMYLAAVERVSQVLQLPSEPQLYELADEHLKDWPPNGEIRFENVTLRYNLQSEPVFIDLNLRISSGQKVGICGRSGSGKSTLASVLFRLLDPTAGCLFISDVNVSRIPPRILRSHLAVVPQDAALLPGSIRDNLDPERASADGVIWEVLEAVRLKDVVEAQVNSLDADIVEVKLSLGQRQLFCLARAILRRATILLLDEATSSLDAEAESNLMQTAFKAFEGKTMIVIAHRLQTLLSCDRILVVERGRIAEDGAPQQLLSKQMGLFSTMLRANEEGI